MEVTMRSSISATTALSALLLVQASARDDRAHAQPGAAVYCADLKRVAGIAMTDARFSAIAAKPRAGNFSDTSLSLAGWRDCSLYGARTYTCDSQPLASALEAERTQAQLLRDFQACLGEGWIEAEERSSASYVVLHSRLRPVSITLSTDVTDQNEHVVRLSMFVRRN
jgi:hypothetical protein